MVEMLHNQDKSISVHNMCRTHNVGSPTVYDIEGQWMKSLKFIQLVEVRDVWLFVRQWRKEQVVSEIRLSYNSLYFTGLTTFLFWETWWHKYRFSVKNWAFNMSVNIAKDGCTTCEVKWKMQIRKHLRSLLISIYSLSHVRSSPRSNYTLVSWLLHWRASHKNICIRNWGGTKWLQWT